MYQLYQTAVQCPIPIPNESIGKTPTDFQQKHIIPIN